MVSTYDITHILPIVDQLAEEHARNLPECDESEKTSLLTGRIADDLNCSLDALRASRRHVVTQRPAA